MIGRVDGQFRALLQVPRSASQTAALTTGACERRPLFCVHAKRTRAARVPIMPRPNGDSEERHEPTAA